MTTSPVPKSGDTMDAGNVIAYIDLLKKQTTLTLDSYYRWHRQYYPEKKMNTEHQRLRILGAAIALYRKLWEVEPSSDAYRNAMNYTLGQTSRVITDREQCELLSILAEKPLPSVVIESYNIWLHQ